MLSRELAWTLAAASLLVAATARAAPDDPDRTLTAQDIQKYFVPYVPAVRDCYLATARGKTSTGELRLDLIIHRDGTIYHFGFVAPGVAAPALGKLEACLRGLVPSWHFPVRRGFTTAVLPFMFHEVHAPGAGPAESCWDPRGCPPGATRGTP